MSKERKAETSKETKIVEPVDGSTPSAATLESIQGQLSKLQNNLRAFQGHFRSSRDHTPCTSAEFRYMVDHIRNVCPPPKGCTCTCVREESEETGFTTKHRKEFTIQIDKRLTRYETEHVLIHEWAHVLAWRPHHPLSGDHGPDWGVWYSLAYRKYHGLE